MLWNIFSWSKVRTIKALFSLIRYIGQTFQLCVKNKLGCCVCFIIPTPFSHQSSSTLSTEKTWTCWSESRGPQSWSEGWSTSAMNTDWDTWGCSAWRREKVLEVLTVVFQYLQEAYKKEGPNLLSGPLARGHQVMTFNWRRVNSPKI